MEMVICRENFHKIVGYSVIVIYTIKQITTMHTTWSLNTELLHTFNNIYFEID